MWLNHDPFPRSFTIFSGFLHVRIAGSYFVLYNFITMSLPTFTNDQLNFAIITWRVKFSYLVASFLKISSLGYVMKTF